MITLDSFRGNGSVDFTQKILNKEGVFDLIQTLKAWENDFTKKVSKLQSQKPTQHWDVAKSIVKQSINSLTKEVHGHIWTANRGPEVCAVLIADDCKDGLVIRFLVANGKENGKGAGTFLVQKMLELAKKTRETIRTTPENSRKYWENKMGFKPDPANCVQLIYTPEDPSNEGISKNNQLKCSSQHDPQKYKKK